jgi:hypothetical protein
MDLEDYLEKNHLDIIESDNRPWGAWYVIEIDEENFLDRKILKVVPHTLLSLQFHGSGDRLGHQETWVALTKIRAIISYESYAERPLNELDLLIVDIEPGGELVIKPGFVHALANPFELDIYVVETRKSQIKEKPDDREKNITRIYDQTRRNGIPAYPDELFKKIMNCNTIPDLVIRNKI